MKQKPNFFTYTRDYLEWKNEFYALTAWLMDCHGSDDAEMSKCATEYVKYLIGKHHALPQDYEIKSIQVAKSYEKEYEVFDDSGLANGVFDEHTIKEFYIVINNEYVIAVVDNDLHLEYIGEQCSKKYADCKAMFTLLCIGKSKQEALNILLFLGRTDLNNDYLPQVILLAADLLPFFEKYSMVHSICAEYAEFLRGQIKE